MEGAHHTMLHTVRVPSVFQGIPQSTEKSKLKHMQDRNRTETDV